MSAPETAGSKDLEQRRRLRAAYLEIDTATVADTLDTMGLPHQTLAASIGSIAGLPLAGWAFTIRGTMASYSGSGDPVKMAAAGEIGPDEIGVWAGGGKGIAYFGELIGLGMQRRGAQGMVVDGGVRDTRGLREAALPIYAAYRSSTQSIGRWRVVERQVPIDMPGATSATVSVLPGDFVLGDEDGVVVVPRALSVAVLAQARGLIETEVLVKTALAEGVSLEECLRRFGHV